MNDAAIVIDDECETACGKCSDFKTPSDFIAAINEDAVRLDLERVEMEIAWQVEIDPFCNRVLEKHWPGVKRYGDIRQIKGADLEPIDLICGGPPCQPVSLAGQRKGAADDRWLWPEALRLVEELHPRWCLFENPPGLISMGIDQVLFDLENAGYSWQAFIVPACGIDAPHQRDRVWIVANAEGKGLQKRQCRPGESKKKNSKAPSDGVFGGFTRLCSRPNERAPQMWPTEPALDRVAPRIPSRVDRLRALGNAVVPQIPEILGRLIMEIDQK